MREREITDRKEGGGVDGEERCLSLFGNENRRRQRESGAATVRIGVGDCEKRLEREGARERSRARENFLRSGRRRRRSGGWRRRQRRVSEEVGEERE
ncbi:hypothetical protein L484_002652 [Morus notabilis]|uniref:Uncharacterized protein n=1 Tax=Morus notabilis TaxID=981085 RepID=W9S736_9ROSA|nr:hypothetical protein L484_002652 [Morus notabilis]